MIKKKKEEEEEEEEEGVEKKKQKNRGGKNNNIKVRSVNAFTRAPRHPNLIQFWTSG